MAEAAVITLAAAREARAEQHAEQAARATRQAELAESYRPGTPVASATKATAFPPLDWQPDGTGRWTTEDARTGMRFLLVETRHGWGGQVIRPNGTSIMVNWSSAGTDLAAAQTWGATWLDTAAATAEPTSPASPPSPPPSQPARGTVKLTRVAVSPARAAASPASPIEQFLAATHPGGQPNDWEAGFLRDVYSRGRSPSAKQRAILDRIEQKTMADLPRLGDYNRQ